MDADNEKTGNISLESFSTILNTNKIAVGKAECELL